jgi:hypothetical protein
MRLSGTTATTPAEASCSACVAKPSWVAVPAPWRNTTAGSGPSRPAGRRTWAVTVTVLVSRTVCSSLTTWWVPTGVVTASDPIAVSGVSLVTEASTGRGFQIGPATAPTAETTSVIASPTPRCRSFTGSS